MKNAERIRTGIRALSYKPHEIICGKVVAGSVDDTNGTFSIRQSPTGNVLEGILINSVTGDNNGVKLYPADESDVVVGSIGGGGDKILLSAGALRMAVIKIGDAEYKMNGDKVSISNGDTVFEISATAYKIKTANESLYSLIKDLITYITVLTVPTSGGPSGVPENTTDFTNLLARLENLLTH